MSVPLRYRGTLAGCPTTMQAVLLDRTTALDSGLAARTAEIIGEVRRDRDRALFRLARELDGVELTTLEVSRMELRRALDSLASDVRRALERARDNIARVHRAGLPLAHEIQVEPGIRVGRRPDPLDRVGVYAPGGRAVYPSSVLMGCIPARVAGVREIVLASPPGRTGKPSDIVLAAAALAEVDLVVSVGGAGAIAAMALGTETIPRVDRIVGPGNAYVAEAKRQLSQFVGIDSFAGPSELLVISDGTVDPSTLAREMIAQAEHDPDACVVALVSNDGEIELVLAALERAIAVEPRREVILASLAGQGAILSVDDLSEAMEFAASYAPEHLLLAVTDPDRLLPAVRNVGTVFLGATSSVVFGDYMTGANHVLPTGGFARIESGLSTWDFVRWTTYQEVDRDAAARLAFDVAVLARAEGLPGHAAAARQWDGAGAIHD